MRGEKAKALIDSAYPVLRDELIEQLRDIEQIDYVVSQHSEQDHACVLLNVLKRFPSAKLLCSEKAREMLMSHLHIPGDRSV